MIIERKPTKANYLKSDMKHFYEFDSYTSTGKVKCKPVGDDRYFYYIDAKQFIMPDEIAR